MVRKRNQCAWLMRGLRGRNVTAGKNCVSEFCVPGGGWVGESYMRHLTVFVLFFEGKETTSKITTVKFLFKLPLHIQ